MSDEITPVTAHMLSLTMKDTKLFFNLHATYELRGFHSTGKTQFIKKLLYSSAIEVKNKIVIIDPFQSFTNFIGQKNIIVHNNVDTIKQLIKVFEDILLNFKVN